MFLVRLPGALVMAMGAAVAEHAGVGDDLGNQFLLAVRHQVNTGNPFHVTDALNQLDTDTLALEFLIIAALEAGDDLVGNMHAGDMAANPPRGARRGQRPDADQDETALIQPHVAHPIHIGLEPGNIKAILGLHELGPGGDLLGQAQGTEIIGRDNGLAAAPRNTRGGVVSARPDRKRDSSRMVRMVSSREMLSRSNTGLAPGWSPACTPSPVRQRMLQTPLAAAPSTSPWMAMRLRSRQDICNTGE